jgi:hypothetical protein
MPLTSTSMGWTMPTEREWNERTAPLTEQIDRLARQSHDNMEERGFWDHFPERFLDDRTWIGEKIGLAHTELSEALQASRNYNTARERHHEILGELADEILRCLDMAGLILTYTPGTSFGQIILDKMKKSVGRGKLHGKRW